MITRVEFSDQLAQAYHHLYDLVKLRTHPLTGLLIDDPSLTPKERSWQFHRLLIDLIDELAPAQNAPIHSREWRSHRIMMRRYVDALTPRQVAEELSLSRRQYFREQASALESAADVLWAKYAN